MDKLLRYWDNFLYSGIDEGSRVSIHLNVLQKISVINISALCGGLTCGIFSLLGKTFLAFEERTVIILAVAALLYMCVLIFTRVSKEPSVGGNILLLNMYGVVFSVIFAKEIYALVYVFIGLIPHITAILKGYKIGTVWNLSFLVIGSLLIISVRILSNLGIYYEPFPFEISLYILLGTINYMIFAIFYERDREKNSKLIERQVEAITQLSKTDHLTQLPNRRASMKLLQDIMERYSVDYQIKPSKLLLFYHIKIGEGKCEPYCKMNE